MALQRFTIRKFRGRAVMTLALKNNRLILAGENGSGKTTVMTILFYFLSRQWRRLARYDFESIEVQFDQVTLEITREEILPMRGLRRPHQRAVEQRVFDRLVEEDLDEIMENPRKRLGLAIELDISPAQLQVLVRDLTEGFRSTFASLRLASQVLRANLPGQILYLPTFRRIERNLATIFPNADASALSRRATRPRDEETFLELVEFGMEDVQQDIEKAMNGLRASFAREMSSLSTQYLTDILEARLGDPWDSTTRPLNLDMLDVVLARMDNALLPPSARQNLRRKAAEWSTGAAPQPQDQPVAHFLSRLITLSERQSAAEVGVRSFETICNAYLGGKRFLYNPFANELGLFMTVGGRDPTGLGDPLPLSDLSSGEKQIVSLFSHLLLSGAPPCFVLIDEPELSLSVPWQERFLPDLLRTERCDGLVAATHSPFIFANNELNDYAHALSEFWRD